MNADLPPETSLLGVKLASLVAGFAGGVVSLSYIQQLTKLQALLAVMTGALVSGYCTPVVTHYLGLSFPLENGVAFFVGLTAMNIVPGMMKLSERWRDDPKLPPSGGPQ